MGVYIKGMEMPKTCRDCKILCEIPLRSDWRKMRNPLCNLIEVAEPHGRLIDADKLKNDNPWHMNADVPYVTEETVSEIIDDAPTVIEAEG